MACNVCIRNSLQLELKSGKCIMACNVTVWFLLKFNHVFLVLNPNGVRPSPVIYRADIINEHLEKYIQFV